MAPQEASKERDVQVPQDDLNPISDNDEDMVVLDDNPLIEQFPSECVLGKRKKSVVSEPEDVADGHRSSENNDGLDDIPLPATQRIMYVRKGSKMVKTLRL